MSKSHGLVSVLGIVALLVCVGVAQADTIAFRQGVDGYAGCEDTYLNRSSGNTNYGSTVALGAWSVPWASTSMTLTTLIRFDDIFGSGANQIAATSDIVNAKLTLTAYRRMGTTSTAYIRANRMLTDWQAGTGDGSAAQEGAACHSVRAFRTDGDYAAHPEDTWGLAGPTTNGPVRFTDWDLPGGTDPFASSPINGNGSTQIEPYVMEFDVTFMVRQWLADPSKNYGLVLFASGTWDGALFHSSQAAAVTDRPLLTVEYVPEPGTMSLIGIGIAGLGLRRRR
jgi:hypothetical protein